MGSRRRVRAWVVLLCWLVVAAGVLLSPAHPQAKEDVESLETELETATGRRRFTLYVAPGAVYPQCLP